MNFIINRNVNLAFNGGTEYFQEIKTQNSPLIGGGYEKITTQTETETTFWGRRHGDADYLNTRGTKGNRWIHFRNQGRQSDT